MADKTRRDPKVVAAIAKRIDAAVANAMEKLGVSQNEVARRAGVSGLSRYRAGTRTPDAETMRKIAAATGTTTDYLLFGVGGPPDEVEPPEDWPNLTRALAIVESDAKLFHPEAGSYLRTIARAYPCDRPFHEWMNEAELFDTRRKARAD